MKTIENITILGGGSSGWMTAAELIRNFPDKNITLIESSDVPTIGVGESTIGSINAFLVDLDFKDEDWMPECNATYKTSIDFTNFDGKGTRVHYPFGASSWLGNYGVHNWFIKQALIGADKTEYAKFALGTIPMIDNNKLTHNEDGRVRGFNFAHDTTYHFDAGLFADYIKRKYCKPRGVNHIIATIAEVKQHENNDISEIIDTEGNSHTADLFVDCSGFRSMLLEQTLKEPFVSFGDILMNDRAIAIRIPYVDKEVEMENSTNATALSCGWVWNTPLWDRIGTGYVFSTRFQSDEDALKEFQEYLINDRDVPHSREEIMSLPHRFVDIKPGIHERAWVNNVCAIGLSNGFIEPIESTGLMLTHNTIFALVQTLQIRESGKVNGYDIQTFNVKVRDTMELFTGFIAAHFAWAERDDTPYWRHITETLQYAGTEKYEWKYFDSMIQDLSIKNDFSIFNTIDGTPFILAGMGHNPLTKISIEHFYQSKEEFNKEYDNARKLQDDINDYNSSQEEYVKTLPSHYEFLKKHIYKD